MSDPVKEPAHYAGDGEVDCKRALQSMMSLDRFRYALKPTSFYWWGCAFKYLWRWPRKNGLQDIDKAIECMFELRSSVSEEDKCK